MRIIIFNKDADENVTVIGDLPSEREGELMDSR